jgi:cysteine synthase
MDIATEDARHMTRWLARTEGLLVGPSTGAAVAAAISVAADVPDGVIVVLSPDGGDKYLSDPLWDERS